MPKLNDITGQQFGRLIVLGISHRQRLSPRRSIVHWQCRCICGTEISVRSSDLGTGNTQSCGCLQIERTRQASITHGHTSGGKWTRAYQAWADMVNRCSNPYNKGFANYGGRGIKVCRRWQKFENFLADMGEKPIGLTLGRINNERGYSPSNCRWETYSQQNKNRRSWKRS